MPKYDYWCPQCDDTIEMSHSMTETPVVPCTKCEQLRRKSYTVPNVSFKGSGWGGQ
jgi:putative FmdB family regulatory protein